MTVTALVPAHRRSDRVGATVAALVALVDEVVVIDDGSDDDGATIAAAAGAGARVVALPANRGKGGALTAGVEATPEATIYLLVDADLAATAAGVRPLLAAIEEGADLVIGVLPSAGTKGGFGTVKRVARDGIRAACGFEAAAPLSGQRAVRADLLRALLPLADRFGVEAGMTIDSVRAGAAVVEVPIDVDHRHTGRSVAGISHRAGQGWDLLRALWPRLADARARGLALAGVALVAIAVLAGLATSARPDGRSLDRAERVVLLGAPTGFELADLDSGASPAFTALAGERGAVGAGQVISARRDPRSLWASVGAGERVEVPAGAEPAPPPEEPFRIQQRVEGAGRLGTALRAAGRRTALVTTATAAPMRWAIADGEGRTDSAATAGSLGPRGMANRARTELRTADLVAVDGTGLDASGFDELLDALRPDPDTLLVVVTPPSVTGPLTLTPLVASGPGAPAGRLTSPSTQRDGLVLAADVAPTVLHALGVAVPAEMTGRAVERIPGPPELDRLERLDRLSRLRAAVWDPSILPLTLGQIALYAWARWRRPAVGSGRARTLFLACLLVSSWPLATWAARAVPGLDRLGPGAAAVALGIAAALVALADRIGRHRGLAPLAVVLGSTIAFVTVDLGVGGPLELSSAFGYAATSAGRFTGLGNGGFAIVATAATVLVGCAPRRAPWIPVLLGGVTLVVGIPVLGNDVGGLLTLAPISIVTVAALWGGLRWRVLALAAVAGVAAVLLAGAYDLSRPADRRTHLGRFLTGGEWADVLVRRTEANLRGYTVIPVLFALVAIVIAMAVGLARGRWPGLLPAGSPARTGLGASLAVALVGHALNDSGPVLVGIACITVGPFLVHQALARDEATTPPQPNWRLPVTANRDP